jgi:hypothetical protein
LDHAWRKKRARVARPVQGQRSLRAGNNVPSRRAAWLLREYKVAFEIDDFDTAARTGWSVLIQGSAHHVQSEAERASVAAAGVEPWPGGERELFLRIVPSRVTGRRIIRTS